jgi:hypothetical protein
VWDFCKEVRVEFGKRIDGPSGQRRATRDAFPLLASAITTTDAMSVVLMDVSHSGAKLQGRLLPAIGKEIVVHLGPFQAFAKVIWSDRSQCGVSFDVPLGDTEVSTLRREAWSGAIFRFVEG